MVSHINTMWIWITPPPSKKPLRKTFFQIALTGINCIGAWSEPGVFSARLGLLFEEKSVSIRSAVVHFFSYA